MHKTLRLLLLWLGACGSQAFIVPCVTNPLSRHYPPSSTPCSSSLPDCTSTVLQANNSTHNDLDSSLLAGDIVAIVVACQLIGLIDVLNEESFWAEGGLAQPMPAVPTTLGIFVQRTSQGCLSWMAASLTGSNESTIASTARIAGVFALVQLGLTFGISQLSTNGIDLVLVARDCYFIVIVIAGWRYAYANLSRL